MRTKMGRWSSAWLLAGITFADVGAARRLVPDVEIVGFDYAFKAPAELPAGLTTFRFRNQGKHRHELNLVQLKAGVSLRQFIDAANADKPLSPMIERTVGVLFAGPGAASASTLSVNLSSGSTYAIQCIFRDSSKTPRHRQLGMFTSILVTNVPRASSDPHQVPTVRHDRRDGLRIQVSTNLGPGRHRFVFVNAGTKRHEVNLARIKSAPRIDRSPSWTQRTATSSRSSTKTTASSTDSAAPPRPGCWTSISSPAASI